MVSPDGRYVAFCCNANVSDLVPGAYGSYNNYYNVYLRDMWAGTNALISQDWYGDGLWDDSATNCVFSPDGHWILFATAASYVTADTPDGVFSLYARNLVEQTTTLISIRPKPSALGGTYATRYSAPILVGWRSSAACARSPFAIWLSKPPRWRPVMAKPPASVGMGVTSPPDTR